MNNIWLVVKLVFFLSLLSSCTVNKTPEIGKTKINPVQELSVTKQAIEATINESTPTTEPTVVPTQTPTKTEIVPALNGTPMPIVEAEIGLENAAEIKVLKQSSSNKWIELLGPEGSKWFLQRGNVGEIHDTKTGELIWEAIGSPYFNIDANGTQAYFFKNEYSEIEVQNQDNTSETITIPPFDKGTRTYFDVALEKRIMLIEPRPDWWYLEPVVDIAVFPWGETTPKYTVKGNIARITIGEKYLTYLQGKTLVFADLETGEKRTEFTIGEGEFESIAYSGIQIWKTSWDDGYLAFSRNGNLEIWRLSDRKMVRSLQIQKDTVLDESQFDFSKNSKAVMVLMPDGMIRTWSIESGEILAEEETTEKSLDHRRVSDDGKIMKFDLPEVAHRAWNTEFTDVSSMAFDKDQETLIFSVQTLRSFPETSDLCEWNLSEAPSCEYQEFFTYEAPANYQFFILGQDNERYYIKPLAKPISLYEGWEKNGKPIVQIPDISVNGSMNDFIYDPGTGIIQLKYSEGTTFIFNHKTRTRLLVNGLIWENLVVQMGTISNAGSPEGLSDWFLISPDGKSVFGLVNNRKDLTILEFVQYDSKTLKEVARLPLDKTVHALVVGKTIEDLTPRISSAVLSPDGKKLFAHVNYVSEKNIEENYKAKLLIIPIEAPDGYSITELELTSGKTTNMLINEKGDMLIIGQSETGKLLFLEAATGKVIHTMDIGGNPIKLALRPDGKMIAVADVKDGIQLVGIPGE